MSTVCWNVVMLHWVPRLWWKISTRIGTTHRSDAKLGFVTPVLRLLERSGELRQDSKFCNSQMVSVDFTMSCSITSSCQQWPHASTAFQSIHSHQTRGFARSTFIMKTALSLKSLSASNFGCCYLCNITLFFCGFN